MQKLDEQQLHEALAKLPQWHLVDGEIVRDWTFPDFVAAMVFVNRVAQETEKAGHHPDIDIRYNRVKLALITHDAGGITATDIKMATILNNLEESESHSPEN
jgi:4a-hydroxytetrahydrobiopterin dehydratase